MHLHNVRDSQLDVRIINREIVDTAVWWCDPPGHLSGLDHALHHAPDESAIVGTG